MDSQSRIAQAYGYAVCFITIITMLVSVGRSVGAVFDYVDPVHADRWNAGAPVTSYNAWKREYLQRQSAATRGGTPATPLLPPTEAELRQMYQDDRNDQIESVRFRSLKTLVGSLLLMAFAGILFAIHWKWLRPPSAQRA